MLDVAIFRLERSRSISAFGSLPLKLLEIPGIMVFYSITPFVIFGNLYVHPF